MTSPYVLSPDNSVAMQSSPQSRMQQPGGFQSFLNNLVQPQQQNGMQQRRKGILGGVQAIQGMQPSPMGSVGGTGIGGALAKAFLL